MKKKADLVSSVSESEINTNFIGKIRKNSNLSNILTKINKLKKYQRQHFNQEFRIDGGFYIFKVKTLYKNKKLFSKKIKGYGFKIERFKSINIEKLEDLKIARGIFGQFLVLKKLFKYH